MKLMVHGQEALEHKGGVLCHIWKSKGPKDECSAYRSILVSSFIGKSLRQSLRQRQNTLFEKLMQKEQLGGRPKVPVTLGVHLGRAFMRARKQQGHNIAMLYLDLTEAFYRILRPLVVGGPVSDELIMHVWGNAWGSPLTCWGTCTASWMSPRLWKRQGCQGICEMPSEPYMWILSSPSEDRETYAGPNYRVLPRGLLR